MQVQSGIDLISIERIKRAVDRLGQPFLDRIWTREEQADCRVDGGHLRDRSAASLAARFAAKEATAKALGSGIGPRGVRWLDISVQKLASGQPVLKLKGAALQLFNEQGGLSLSISLAHEKDLALAQCVMLRKSS